MLQQVTFHQIKDLQDETVHLHGLVVHSFPFKYRSDSTDDFRCSMTRSHDLRQYRTHLVYVGLFTGQPAQTRVRT